MNRLLSILFFMGLLSNAINAQVANRYDIVIDELMIDPTPTVGLPNNEWIELHNISSIPFNLSGWKIGDATSQSGTMPSFILLPDSFVIICTAGAVAAMSSYGTAIAVTGFPSLDNTGDIIYLRSAQNKAIHAVSYTDGWYQNALKKDGGWTLEMIDTRNPCTGSSNWKASIDPKGGTAGKKNSVDKINADVSPPKLWRAFAVDSLNISLLFDEPLDSAKAATAANYTIGDGIGIPQSAISIAPLFDKVNLKLNTALSPHKIYTINTSAITDCMNNPIGNNNSARVGLAETADSLDIVVNEILFNPKPNGADYVEIYNRRDKIIDLKQIFIANRNAAGLISNIEQLASDNYLFFPGDFIVITEDPAIVKRDFITLNIDAFIAVSSMPPYNDDNGDVIFLDVQGNIIDELNYDEKWHFKLIDNREGIALERIDYHAPTRQAENWHSAATSTGYGTPAYKNSQYRIDLQAQGEMTISPEIISPDNDGKDDFATVQFDFPSPGYIASISIFDGAGRPVKYLQRNALCGIKANFRWDGLGEKDQKLPIGIYIIYAQVFNLEGKKKQFKKTIVLARK